MADKRGGERKTEMLKAGIARHLTLALSPIEAERGADNSKSLSTEMAMREVNREM